MKAWKEERSAERPSELQLISPETYIQRRNIEEEHHEATEDMEAYTDYVCESRIVTVSEYEMLKSIEEIDSSEAIDAYTEELIEEGVL